MKFLILAISLLSFNLFGQSEEFTEDDSTDYYAEYHLLGYKPWGDEEFVPSEENIEWDKFTKIMYNPFVNNDVLDSILRWRESKGLKPIEFDRDASVGKMREEMTWTGMYLAEAEKSKVTLGIFYEEEPDCECVTDIATQILDDSTIFIMNKKGKEKIFNTYLLSNRIKRIEVYYYQMSRKEDPDKEEEHLVVKIKKRFALFTWPYQIF